MAQPKLGSEKGGRRIDVVGIEVGGSKTRAVRLVRAASGVEIAAIGELPPIQLPSSAEERSDAVLLVPKPLAAPYAAFAVDSPRSLVRLVSLKVTPELDEAAALAELFGSAPPSDYRAGFANVGEAGRADLLYVACGLPNYVASAVAQLLPEARRPAPASLQLTATAKLNAFALGPGLRHGSDGIVLLLVEEVLSTVAVFNAGRLTAYRQFPVGNGAVVDQVAQQFGLSTALASELLNENHIDPSSATVPVLTPLFRQVAMSTEFVARREGCKITHVYLHGSISGSGHWLRMAETVMAVGAECWMPFDDHPRRPRAVPQSLAGTENVFVAALGAALALMEGE